MNRLCNDVDRKVLRDNRDMMLRGISKTTSKSSYAPFFIGIILSVIIGIAGCIAIVEWFKNSDLLACIWLLFSFTVPNILLAVIMGKLRARRMLSDVFESNTLAINGATVVEVNPVRGTISFIEDDYVDSLGNPIIIDYPASTKAESGMVTVGTRLLVLHSDKAGFQLMRLNEVLCRLIPQYDTRFPLRDDISNYRRVPHPNATRISPLQRAVAQGEKEIFTNKYVTMMQASTMRVGIICSCIVVVGTILASYILGMRENNVVEAMVIGGLICIGYALLMMVCRMIGRANFRRKAQFQTVQEVIFHSNIVDRSGRAVISRVCVYVWEDGRYQMLSYNVDWLPKNVKYGDIMYKLVNHKGRTAFINKED